MMRSRLGHGARVSAAGVSAHFLRGARADPSASGGGRETRRLAASRVHVVDFAAVVPMRAASTLVAAWTPAAGFVCNFNDCVRLLD
jgi:hypothetical protein